MRSQSTDTHRRLSRQVQRLEQGGLANDLIVHFARAVLASVPPQIDCDLCLDVLPEYIEAELNNGPLIEYRPVRHHVDLCPACSQVYLDLLELALLAEEGPLPASDLPIDLSFLDPAQERSHGDA